MGRGIGGLVAALFLGGGGLMGQADLLLREEFDGADVPPRWRAVGGSWRIERGALLADALAGEAFVLAGDPAWEDIEIEATASFEKVKEPSRWLSVLFRASADGAPPWSHVCVRQGTDARNGVEFAVRTEGGFSVRAAGRGKAPTPIGRPIVLRISVSGERIVASLDGERILESTFCVDRPAGLVGFGANGCVARFEGIAVRRLPKPPPATPGVDPAKTICVGHRGFSHRAPENTIASIARAIEAGADGVEFDVRRTRDGVAILMHDATVDRTTDGKGEVAALDLAEIRGLDAGSWKDPSYAGEPVPTLAEALGRIRASGVRPVIEIKVEGIGDLIVRAVREADLLERAVVISFLDEAIAEVRALEPTLRCGLLVGEAPPGDAEAQADAIVARARACGAEIVDLHYGLLSPELAAALRRRGFPVWCWTVNERPVMEALIRRGVESITTDRPDILVPLARGGR